MLGLGATFTHQKIEGNGAASNINDNYFNFQITPIGISIGNVLSGFIETGFGYKGILHVGAACKL